MRLSDSFLAIKRNLVNWNIECGAHILLKWSLLEILMVLLSVKHYILYDRIVHLCSWNFKLILRTHFEDFQLGKIAGAFGARGAAIVALFHFNVCCRINVLLYWNFFPYRTYHFINLVTHLVVTCEFIFMDFASSAILNSFSLHYRT